MLSPDAKPRIDRALFASNGPLAIPRQQATQPPVSLAIANAGANLQNGLPIALTPDADRPGLTKTQAAVERTVTEHAVTVRTLPQPAATAHAALQAQWQENVEQDIKLHSREIAVGATGIDRPVSGTGSAIQAAQSASTESARHIASQISVSVSQGHGKTTEILLNPEELGRVRLTISAGEGALTLTVLADRPETQELLRRHIDVLAQEFKALGYQDLAFAFAEGGHSDGSDSPEEGELNGGTSVIENETIQEQALGLPSSGLDLRL
jgi:flagellar hook-length control protein FliK